MNKKMIRIVTVVCAAICLFLVLQTKAEAKPKYINNKNFQGTFTIGGKKCTFESGGYEIVINNITSKGNVVFQMHRYSANAMKMSDTDVITAKLKKNKITFKFTDGYDCSLEKGTIVFNKNKSVNLRVKQLKKGPYPGYNMEIKNTNFKKSSKKHKVYSE